MSNNSDSQGISSSTKTTSSTSPPKLDPQKQQLNTDTSKSRTQTNPRENYVPTISASTDSDQIGSEGTLEHVSSLDIQASTSSNVNRRINNSISSERKKNDRVPSKATRMQLKDQRNAKRQNTQNQPSSSRPQRLVYMNNVVQHPLHNTCFIRPNNITVENITNQNTIALMQQQQQRAVTNKQKKKNKDIQNFRFEPYLKLPEITEGLKNGSLLEGSLRINPKQFQFGYLSGGDPSEPDIFIDGLRNRNRALEGDVVVVQLLTDGESNDSGEEKPKKRGKVVYIREKKHKRICLGQLKLMADKNRKRALFIPRDSRVPRLNIPCTNWPSNFYNNSKMYENTLFMAKIVDWFDVRFAIGMIVQIIGESGDLISESRAILAQNDLDVKPYGPEVRKLFPGDDYTIPAEELQLREDCRKLCLFSIDPYNCRDIDDAVSCRQLDNGIYEIGVHISDVAHFLSENTTLDKQVSDKATTIYMVERAYHMLPDELCVLCSLFPGEDKLAFSVFWEITQDARVLSHRFAKTVIHSCCQLAYEHAQAILDDQDNAESTFPEIYNGQKYEDIKKTIKTLGKLSAVFRNNRFEAGALRIDQPKVAFKLNPLNLLPDSFSIYDSKTSHQLIEEFMLLANMTVAKRIYEDYPNFAFLRCHPPPSLYMMRQLQKSLLPMGIEVDITSAGSVNRSLVAYAGPDCADKGKAMVLGMLCAKPMARAKYFCAGGVEVDDDFAHYALNVPLYTHFTSPIRRYADIVVHRLLAASLKTRPPPEWKVDAVRAIAAQCNKQKYNAKKAGDMSTELYTLKYIQLHAPMAVDAVVVDVRERFLDVIVVAMGLNRRIYLNSDFPGIYKYIKNDLGAKLSKWEITWTRTATEPEVTQTVQVFTVLQVQMSEGEDVTKVSTTLVRPAPGLAAPAPSPAPAPAPPAPAVPADQAARLLASLVV